MRELQIFHKHLPFGQPSSTKKIAREDIIFEYLINWGFPPPWEITLTKDKSGLSTFHLFWGLTTMWISSEWDELGAILTL